MNRLTAGIAVAAAAVMIGWTALHMPYGRTEAKMGGQAPAIRLSSLEQTTYTLRPGPGKALVVNFWASWCEPCRREAPELQAFHENHRDLADVYAINLTARDRVDLASAFAEQNGLRIPVLLDENSQAADAYHIAAVPVTYVIAPDGTLAARHVGPIDRSGLEALVQEAFR